MATLRQGAQVDLEDSINRFLGAFSLGSYIRYGQNLSTAPAGTESFTVKTISNIGAGASVTQIVTGNNYTGDQTIALGQTDFKYYNAAVIMDQAGTLAIQQTYDGTNYDLVSSVAIVAGTGIALQALAMGQSFKVVITNSGGVATTYVRAIIFSSP